MKNNEKKKTKTPRELLTERMGARYPDKHFYAQDAQDAQEPADDLEQAILDTLDEFDTKNSELVNLFNTDPRSAEFITEWVRTGDPRSALIETFGDDFFDAGSKEEAKVKFKSQLDSWREKRRKETEIQAEYERNWNNSLETLDGWGDERGLSQEQKADIMARLISVSGNAIAGIYTPEDFEMANNAMNYKNDVAKAHDAGVVDGRNERISASRKSKADAGKLPPAVTGQGVRAKEPQPAKPQSVWAGLK